MTDVSTDQLWEDLQRLLDEHSMTVEEFEERGESDDLTDTPVLEYAYKAIWPVIRENLVA